MLCTAATDQSESRDVVCKQSSSADNIHGDNQVSDDDNDDNRYYLAVLPDAPVSNRSSSVSSIESIGDTNAEHCYVGLNVPPDIANNQDTNKLTNTEHYLDVLPDDTDNQVPQTLSLELNDDEDDNENRYLVVLPNAPVSNRSSSVSSVESIGDTNAEHCYVGLNVPAVNTDSDTTQSCI